jgi:AcrR family transcriptional regulator
LRPPLDYFEGSFDGDERRAVAGRSQCALAADVTEAAHTTPARSAAEQALLDAAERLLVEVGYAGITTRRLAEEAGVNHGLVHYYFGSNENLLVRALERFTERLIARQRELYAADLPFVEKWRTAMRYLMSEDATYEKIWLELQALSWNNADLRARLAVVNDEWRAVLTEAFAEPHRELGIEMPLDALLSLVMTFNIGMIVERLGGIETGHAELLEWIDQWLSS